MVRNAVARLNDAGIKVSLFVDPDPSQIEAAVAIEAAAVELHTGAYAHAFAEGKSAKHLEDLTKAAALAHRLGLDVDAGHGLTYKNVLPIVAIPHIEELNIGHSIISRALFVGLQEAVREMKSLCSQR